MSDRNGGMPVLCIQLSLREHKQRAQPQLRSCHDKMQSKAILSEKRSREMVSVEVVINLGGIVSFLRQVVVVVMVPTPWATPAPRPAPPTVLIRGLRLLAARPFGSLALRQVVVV